MPGGTLRSTIKVYLIPITECVIIITKGIFLKRKNKKIGGVFLCFFFLFLFYLFDLKQQTMGFHWMFFSFPMVLWNWVKHDMCSLFNNILANKYTPLETLPHISLPLSRNSKKVQVKHRIGNSVGIVLISVWEVYKGFILLLLSLYNMKDMTFFWLI